MMMRRRLFSIGDTAVYLHLATLLFAVYMAVLGQLDVLVVSTFSILIHEGAHGAASALMGKPPAEIELTPLGALMRLEDEETLPLPKRLLMLSAGPAASLLLCWAAILTVKGGWMALEEGRMLFSCNLVLLVLNMLPVLPLDGGRMLTLLLSLRLRKETVKRVMRIIGTVTGLLCIGGNFFLSLRYGGWNLSLAMTGCFLMYAGAVGTTSAAMAELRMFMDRKVRLEQHGSLPCRWVTILDSLPLRKAVACLAPNRHTMFNLLRCGSMEPCGQVGEEALIAAYLNTPGSSCKILLQVGEQA